MSLSDDAYDLWILLEQMLDEWEELEEVSLEDLDRIDQIFPELRSMCTNSAFKLLCLVCEHMDKKRGT